MYFTTARRSPLGTAVAPLAIAAVTRSIALLTDVKHLLRYLAKVQVRWVGESGQQRFRLRSKGRYGKGSQR